MAGKDGGPGALFKSYERMVGDGLGKKCLQAVVGDLGSSTIACKRNMLYQRPST